MKRKTPKIFRVFMVLAMVAGIVGSLVPLHQASARFAATPTVTLTDTRAGAVSGYTITGVVNTATVDGSDVFTIIFPATSTVPAGALTGITLTAGTTPITSAMTAVGTVATRTIVATAAAVIDGDATTTVAEVGTALVITIPAAVGVTNVTTANATNTLTVNQTTGDAAAVTSAVYTTTVGLTNVNNPTTSGAAAQWTATLANTTALTAAVDTITLTWPAGTTVPATISGALITVGGTVVSATGANTSVSGRALTFIVPANIAAAQSTAIVVSQLAGVTNPSKATTFGTTAVTPVTYYRMTVSTSQDTTTVSAYSQFTVVAYVTASATTATEGGTVTITGGGFTPSRVVNLSGGVVTGSGTTDTSGNFSIAGTKSATAGPTAVTATDGDGNAQATATTVSLRPSITATTSGKAQDTVTIEGRNFTVGSNVAAVTAITLGGTALAAANVTSTIPAVHTNRDLTDAVLDDFRIYIKIPSGTGSGVRRIVVTDAGAATANTTITVTGRAVSISPSSGPVGTIVTVTGTGFPASVPAAAANIVSVGGSTASSGQTTLSTDTQGGFSTQFAIPTLAAGSHTVMGSFLGPRDAAANTGFSAFTVTAATGTVSLSPATGPRGTSVTVTGTGFNATTQVNVGSLTLGGAAWNTTAAIAVDGFGGLAASTQSVPAGSAYGSNTVVATDTGVRSGVASFEVTQPTIASATTSGPIGSTVTVTGAGWKPNSVVTITRQGAGALTAQSDGAGAFTGQLPIPAALFNNGALRPVVIGANDGTTVGNVAATLTWTMDGAAVTIDKSSAAVSDTVTVSGTSFQPFTGVTALTIGGANVLGSTPVVTNNLGAFSTSFVVPGLVGVQTISATVGSAPAQTQPITVTQAVGGAGQPVNTDQALDPLISAGTLEIATGFNYTTGAYEAFVPSLGTNPLVQVQPNSVLILTLTADATVVVSGVSFSVLAGVPTPLPVGNTVSITTP